MLGDSDGDGICNDLDQCLGNDALGDSDGDGSCDDTDLCVGNDGSGDSDGDGVCNDQDPCPFDAGDDADNDGLCDDVDLCPGTTFPETYVPTTGVLNSNRYALVNANDLFDNGAQLDPPNALALEDTGGCSCEQILHYYEGQAQNPFFPSGGGTSGTGGGQGGSSGGGNGNGNGGGEWENLSLIHI